MIFLENSRSSSRLSGRQFAFGAFAVLLFANSVVPGARAQDPAAPDTAAQDTAAQDTAAQGTAPQEAAAEAVRKTSVPPGFDRVLLKKAADDPTDLTLRLNYVAESRCTFGDLDAISLDLRTFQGKARLQTTLESLWASRREVLYAEPIEGESDRGKYFGSLTLKVPYSETPRVFGIYICSAPTEEQTENQKPCSEKAIVSVEEAMSPHKVDVEKGFRPDGNPGPAPLANRSNATPDFKNYFFGFVVVIGDTILVPSNSMSDPGYEVVFQYLRSSSADVTDFTKLEEQLRSTNGMLTSRPLVAEGSSIEVLLPYYNAKKCAG